MATSALDDANPTSNQPAIDYLSLKSIYSIPTATTIFYFLLITLLLLKYKKQSDQSRARLAQKLLKNEIKFIPAPMRMPVIGNMYMLREYQENPWDGLDAIRKQFGDIVSLQMGVHPMILLSDFELMREVLIDKAEIFADRPNFSRYKIIFGGSKEHSLALCNWSDIHRVRRKFCKRAVVPSKFSARNQLLVNIINQHTEKFVKNFVGKLHDSNSSAKLSKPDCLFLTGDIFLEFLCEEKYSHDDGSYQKFNWCCDYIFYDINQSQLIDFLPYLSKIGIQRNYMRNLAKITNDCRYFVEAKIFDARYAKHKIEMENRKASGQGYTSLIDDSHDYLDKIILEQLQEKTIMKLEDYKVGFSDMLAGHSAVSNILMKLLGHLALDTEAQEMLCDEARQARSADDPDSRTQLPVAEAALLEALRLASSPIVPHIAREDTTIGDYFVPKGSNILFNGFHINMSPDFWHEPRKFNIKRFLIERLDELTGLKNYSLDVPKYFNPFSVGLRQCLGFRMVEAISIKAVSSICERFILRVDDKQLAQRLLEPRGSIALSPSERCYELELTLRDLQ